MPFIGQQKHLTGSNIRARTQQQKQQQQQQSGTITRRGNDSISGSRQRRKIETDGGLTTTEGSSVEILKEKTPTMAHRHLIWLVWRSSAVLLHLIAFSIYLFLIIRDQYIRYKSSKQFEFPGPWRFLTYWDIWLQLITFSLCLICDCFAQNYSSSDQNLLSVASSALAQSSQSIKSSGMTNIQLDEHATNQQHPSTAKLTSGITSINTKIFDLRDNIVIALAYPIGTFVTIMFWTIYLIDEDSIASPELRKATPWYVQHLQHTVIAPLILLEILICHHRILSVRTHLITILIFMTSYIAWLLFLGNHLSIWVYPLFEKFTWWQTGLFLCVTSVVAMVLYRLGLFIMSRLWTEKLVQQYYKSHMESYALSERE